MLGQDGEHDEMRSTLHVLLHAMLLIFSANFKKNLIYNRFTLARLLLVEYEEEYSTVHGINKLGCNET